MRGDAGFGIIEAVISVALLALIVVPVTRIVVTAEGASNGLHLRVEASNLATQALETAQYQTANGVSPTPGSTTTTELSGTDSFQVTVDWELAAGATSASSSICLEPPGQLSSRIWTVKVTVSWGNTSQEGQKGSVVATTLVSPAMADLADNNAAEIAVPVYTAADSATLETAQAIGVSVKGSCAGSQCATETVPSNEVTSESGNTGSSGCAVFTDLFAGAGWTYNITVTPPSPYVDPNELFYNSPANGLQFWSNVNVQANTVTVASDPDLILAPGATMYVKFNTVNFGTTVPPTSDTGVNPAPYLPISVNSDLLCSSPLAATCVLGNLTGSGVASYSFSGSQSALLYPGPTVTDVSIASVTTVKNSTSVTVASGGFPGVVAGWGVSSSSSSLPNDIASGTYVVSISGNTLTLSAAATAAGTVTLTFLPPNYTAWAGDQADSSPTNGDYGAADATSFQDLGTTSNGTLTLPVYPLTLSLTVKSDAGTVSALTATDSGGGDTMTLNGTSGTSATGLPLGQFEIEASGSGSNDTVSSGGSYPVYVWMLPTGVCEQAGSPITNPTTCTPSTSPISVTVG
jgi:hypothetical protein